MDIQSWFVIVMGLCTVFIGLICIIVLCKILGAICTLIERKNTAPSANAPASAPVSAAPSISKAQNPAKRQEIVAAIGVAIAEECGVDVNAIRITSIKKI